MHQITSNTAQKSAIVSWWCQVWKCLPKRVWTWLIPRQKTQSTLENCRTKVSCKYLNIACASSRGSVLGSIHLNLCIKKSKQAMLTSKPSDKQYELSLEDHPPPRDLNLSQLIHGVSHTDVLAACESTVSLKQASPHVMRSCGSMASIPWTSSTNQSEIISARQELWTWCLTMDNCEWPW